MSTFTCSPLGDITFVAVNQQPHKPRQKYLKTQRPSLTQPHGWTHDGHGITPLQVFRSIAETVAGIDTVEPCPRSSRIDADLVITMKAGITVKQMNEIMASYLLRVTKCIERQLTQHVGLYTGGNGFAVHSEVAAYHGASAD